MRTGRIVAAVLAAPLLAGTAYLGTAAADTPPAPIPTPVPVVPPTPTPIPTPVPVPVPVPLPGGGLDNGRGNGGFDNGLHLGRFHHRHLICRVVFINQVGRLGGGGFGDGFGFHHHRFIHRVPVVICFRTW